MNAVVPGLRLLSEVAVDLSVELGRTQMPLKQVLALRQDSIVPLDRLTDELLDVLVNGRVIARAEVVTVENRFGLRIVELLGEEEPEASSASADSHLGGLATDPSGRADGPQAGQTGHAQGYPQNQTGKVEPGKAALGASDSEAG